MSRVLVTGGAGFIGGYVVQELEQRGDQALVFDRRRRPGKHEAIFGDVRDSVLVSTAVDECDGVIHLAGVLGTQETVRRPRTAVETNILGTLNVLEACLQADVPLVVISVGNWWMINPYSITKHTAEQLAAMFHKELGAKISIVRALNAYGPGQKLHPVRKIVPTFVAAALANRPIEIYGDGNQVMDMIHVRDVAQALVRALDLQPEVIIEAGTGRPTTVNQIADMVLSTVGGGTTTHIPMRPGEKPGSIVLANTDTLDEVSMKLEDLTTLEEGLCETVEWYRSSGLPGT